MADILTRTSEGSPWRLMTIQEAEDIRGLPEHEYSSLVNLAFPEAWHYAIQTEPQRYHSNLGGPKLPTVQEGTVFSTPRHTILVTAPPTLTKKGKGTIVQRLAGTARLADTGEVVPLGMRCHELITSHLQTRLRPLPTTAEEELERLEEDPLSPDALRQLDAERLQLEALAPRGAPEEEDAEELGYVRPTTLREARLMALGSATTSTLTNLAAATAWRPFRTIDATNPRAHYYPWLRRLRPATQRLVVKRWVDNTQAAWLPGQARDSYRRRLLSADYMGPEKCSQGWEFCARCRLACGGLAACTPAQHEDVLHACELCPAPGGAAEIMLIVT